MVLMYNPQTQYITEQHHNKRTRWHSIIQRVHDRVNWKNPKDPNKDYSGDESQRY